MRIPPFFLETISFVCEQSSAKGYDARNIAGGTAFFVSVPNDSDSGASWIYVVTARHCIEELPASSVYLRVPTVTGASKFGYIDLRTNKDDWFRHDSADVAIIPFIINAAINYRFKAIPLSAFISSDYQFIPPSGTFGPRFQFHQGTYTSSTSLPIEVGDDLFFPGLFVQSAGNERMLPVARFGSIARMPTEEQVFLETRSRGDIGLKAYLVECHSWGGFSGSPVFWTYLFNEADSQGNIVRGNVNCTALLGLIAGHFNIEAPTSNKVTQEQLVTKINSGLAIVTPAENIVELLMRDDVVQDRKQRAAAEKQPSATADLAEDTVSAEQTTKKE
jgi:hypothetical protein